VSIISLLVGWLSMYCTLGGSLVGRPLRRGAISLNESTWKYSGYLTHTSIQGPRRQWMFVIRVWGLHTPLSSVQRYAHCLSNRRVKPPPPLAVPCDTPLNIESRVLPQHPPENEHVLFPIITRCDWLLEILVRR